MQHVITWPRCTFHSAILSLGHMEEELSTACRAAADALEILSNLRPGFPRNKQFNSSLCQANSGERQVNDEELQANESAVQSSTSPASSSSIWRAFPVNIQTTLICNTSITFLCHILITLDQSNQTILPVHNGEIQHSPHELFGLLTPYHQMNQSRGVLQTTVYQAHDRHHQRPRSRCS